jgi:threonine aldolase
MAHTANAACMRLADGLRAKGAQLIHEPQANMIFTRFARSTHQKLQAAGARYYVQDGDVAAGDRAALLSARLVCDWSMTDALVDEFLGHF